MLIDIEAGDPARFARPQIALPPADAHEAQIVELDVAVMTFANSPEQHRFAEAVVRCLGEGARTGNRTAAIVEPVADNVPVRDIAHRGLRYGGGGANLCRNLRLELERFSAHHRSHHLGSQLPGSAITAVNLPRERRSCEMGGGPVLAAIC